MNAPRTTMMPVPFSSSCLRGTTPSPNDDRATGLPLVSCWQVSSLPANQEEKAESGLCCSGKAIVLWFEKPLRLMKILVFLHVPDWGAPRAGFRCTVSLWMLPRPFFPDFLRCHIHRRLPSDWGAGHSRGQLSAPGFQTAAILGPGTQRTHLSPARHRPPVWP